MLACHVHACHVDAYSGRVAIACECGDRSSDVVQEYSVLIEKQRPVHDVFTDMPSFCPSAETAGSFTIRNLPRQLDQVR